VIIQAANKYQGFLNAELTEALSFYSAKVLVIRAGVVGLAAIGIASYSAKPAAAAVVALSIHRHNLLRSLVSCLVLGCCCERF